MSFFFGLIIGNIVASNGFTILRDKHLFIEHEYGGTRITDHDKINVVTDKCKIVNRLLFTTLHYDDGWEWYIRPIVTHYNKFHQN